ncbi:hypothetical protein DL98DRAFT_496291 [Cadophora sp. DSE1049]|nr:hypothetical protein DL98DRAFT_496291 [Cadophora sp. DSE1049]
MLQCTLASTLESLLRHPLLVCTALLAITVHANPQQISLYTTDPMVEIEKVPGHNNATYGPVPKNEQLLSVEFLEIAPTPIVADRVFFIYLRGWIPSATPPLNLKSPDSDSGLSNATLKVSSSAVYPDGSSDPSESLTIPFKSTVFNDAAHLVIRDESGKQVEHLPTTGRVDILLDFQIPTMFLRSGDWTFEVNARLGDEGDRCLFAFELRQWLDGELG